MPAAPSCFPLFKVVHMMEQFIQALDSLREISLASTALRMALAILFGGFIGMEREQKRHPAGFRTYMLVCLGAATTMMLSQYEALMLSTRWTEAAAAVGAKTDVARIGAQVINGVGFLGAGTILVTNHHEVKGAITAACLWASACMGLAIGAGFYECTVVGFVLIYSCVKFFPKVENFLLSNSRNLNLYVEFRNIQDMAQIVARIKAQDIEVLDIDLARNRVGDSPGAVFALHLPKRLSHVQAVAALSEVDCVKFINEI